MATKKPKPISAEDAALNKQYGKGGTNLFTDIARGASADANWLGTGLKAIGQGVKKADRYLGSDGSLDPITLLARIPVNNYNVPSAKSAPAAKTVKRGFTAPAQTAQPAAVPQSLASSLAEYMAQAQSLGLGGGDGTNYDSLINQIKANGVTGDAKLAAMYSQLGNSVQADQPGIQQNFANTGTAIANNSDQAAQATNDAYQSTRDAQTAQLAALGIGNAAGVLAANGGQAARDQNLANSDIQINKAADLNQNTAHSANAVQYNTGVKQAVGQQGAEARSTLQQQLAQKLAELESAKSTANSGTQTALFNAALQLKGMDPNDPNNIAAAQQAATKNDLSNSLTASQIALNYAKSQGSSQTLQSALSGSASSYTQLQKAFAAQGGDPSDQKAFGSFVTTLKTINSIK